MERIQFIEHRGKEILHLNLCHAQPQEVIQLVRDAMPLIVQHPEKSLRTLTDVSYMGFDNAVTEALKQFAKHNKPYVLAGAVVGVTGLKRIIYNAVVRFSGRRLVAFDTVQQAKEWLAMQ